MKTIKALIVIVVLFICVNAKAQTEKIEMPKFNGEIVVLRITEYRNCVLSISDNKGVKYSVEVKSQVSDHPESYAVAIGQINAQGYKIVSTSSLVWENAQIVITYIFKKE